MITDDEMREALDRVARTADGELIYRYFQKTLCSVSTDPNESALREHNGRRRFATELMGHMAEGIRASGRPADPTVTFAVAGPRSISGSGGPGRIRAALARADQPGPGSETGTG